MASTFGCVRPNLLGVSLSRKIGCHTLPLAATDLHVPQTYTCRSDAHTHGLLPACNAETHGAATRTHFRHTNTPATWRHHTRGCYLHVPHTHTKLLSCMHCRDKRGCYQHALQKNTQLLPGGTTDTQGCYVHALQTSTHTRAATCTHHRNTRSCYPHALQIHTELLPARTTHRRVCYLLAPQTHTQGSYELWKIIEFDVGLEKCHFAWKSLWKSLKFIEKYQFETVKIFFISNWYSLFFNDP